MSSVQRLKQEVSETLNGPLAEQLRGMSRDIHRHPEIAFQEHRTVAGLASFLAARDQAAKVGIAGLPTAFETAIGESSSGPTVAILAEYDALPGLGHACGHNVIATSAVGAFLALASLGELPGRVRLIGTPAEEDGGGKVIMHEAGVFAGLDAAMMMHPFDETFPFVEFAGRVPLTVVFHGRAAHAGSMPEYGISALDAAVLFLTGLGSLRQRLRDGARFHGILAEGGTSAAIIPERTRVELYLRAYDQNVLNEMVEMVGACARGAAEQIGATIDIESRTRTFQSFVCNRPLAAAMSANLSLAGAAPRDDVSRAFAATDFGNVSHAVPSVHPYVGMGNGLVCHTPEFAEAAGDERGDSVMSQGARALAMSVLDVLFDARLRAEMKADHVRRA